MSGIGQETLVIRLLKISCYKYIKTITQKEKQKASPGQRLAS